MLGICPACRVVHEEVVEEHRYHAGHSSNGRALQVKTYGKLSNRQSKKLSWWFAIGGGLREVQTTGF